MVSVIINSYKENRVLFERALRSIVADQIILSTVKGDPCIEWSKQFDVDIVINENPGIFTQLNAATKKIKHDFVYYFSSNDTALSDKVKIEKSFLKKGKHVCYSAFYVYQDDEIKIARFHDYSIEKHLKGNFVNDAALVRTEIFQKYMPFRVEYGNYSYWDLWLRIYEGEGNCFAYNPVPTFNYYIHKESRHIKRKSDPAKIAEYKKIKNKMLSAHAVR